MPFWAKKHRFQRIFFMVESYLYQFSRTLFDLVVDSGFWLFLGLFLAGIIHEFIPVGALARHLSGYGFKPVAKAALIGTPLPLCSCGVIPTAVELRCAGASRSATMSFLISTPETGVDSIAVSYALLDPLLTILRPFAALFTAFFAGFLEIFFGKESSRKPTIPLPVENSVSPIEQKPRKIAKSNLIHRLRRAIAYGFADLFGDIALYLLFGFALSAVISVFISADLIYRSIGQNSFLSMLFMAGIGTPLYICSTSATPIASSLLAKGLNPGAAVVLLLVGPATNTTTMVAVAKFLGRRSLALYLLGIGLASLLIGATINFLYSALHLFPQNQLGMGSEIIPEEIKLIFGLGLAVLLLWYAVQALFRGQGIRRFLFQHKSNPERKQN